jgi:hypothetical protein
MNNLPGIVIRFFLDESYAPGYNTRRFVTCLFKKAFTFQKSEGNGEILNTSNFFVRGARGRNHVN